MLITGPHPFLINPRRVSAGYPTAVRFPPFTPSFAVPTHALRHRIQTAGIVCGPFSFPHSLLIVHELPPLRE